MHFKACSTTATLKTHQKTFQDNNAATHRLSRIWRKGKGSSKLLPHFIIMASCRLQLLLRSWVAEAGEEKKISSWKLFRQKTHLHNVAASLTRELLFQKKNCDQAWSNACSSFSSTYHTRGDPIYTHVSYKKKYDRPKNLLSGGMGNTTTLPS